MKKQIVLKRNEEHRILNGHQWIFSNELSSVRGSLEKGDIVEILRSDEKFLGLGFYHPHSLIACRFLSDKQEEIDFKYFENRIQQALKLRQTIYPNSETYRLVHGESDFLPGLIIDKYNEFFSIQVLSAGMELQTDIICDVLESIFHPKAIIARNDIAIRTLEELPIEKKILRGNSGVTIIDDGVIKYEVNIFEGQKTGFFLDQRDNRNAVHKYVKGTNVLDCFCNEGGFALHCAAGKAKSVIGIDISETAVAKAKINARLNNLDVEFETGDVLSTLRRYAEENNLFDVIILDPPSYTKSKKNIPAALRGYKDLNTSALKILKPGGFLITASCSHHITKEGFLSAIEQAALKTKRKLRLMEFRGASLDHPVIPSMPETEYLKFAVYAVS